MGLRSVFKDVCVRFVDFVQWRMNVKYSKLAATVTLWCSAILSVCP
jgi:hypothetical protein